MRHNPALQQKIGVGCFRRDQPIGVDLSGREWRRRQKNFIERSRFVVSILSGLFAPILAERCRYGAVD